MAADLGRAFGTRHDHLNCEDHLRTGTCRRGSDCRRLHIPIETDTVLLPNLYRGEREGEKSLEDVIRDVYQEFSRYSTIRSIYISNNTANHLSGNCYVRLRTVEEAATAVDNLRGRIYWGRDINAIVSPVNDIHGALCRYNLRQACQRGQGCSYLHLVHIRRELIDTLERRYNNRQGRRSPRRYNNRRRRRHQRRYNNRQGRRHH